MAREGLAALIGQLGSTEVANGELRIELTQYPGLVPLHFQPRRVPQDEVEPATLNQHIGKAQLPVHETTPRGNPFHHRHPRKVLTQALDAQLAELVVKTATRRGLLRHHLQRQLRLKPFEVGLHLRHQQLRCIGSRQKVERGLRREIDDVTFQDGAHLHPPFLAAWQAAALGDGPEPKRAPVVHHQLQAAEGRRQVAVLIQQVLAADCFLLGSGQR